VPRFIYYYAECHFAECQYAECHYAECHFAECHFAECHYAECHYAEFRYAEYRVTVNVDTSLAIFIKTLLTTQSKLTCSIKKMIAYCVQW
jgi:hypothetical protein